MATHVTATDEILDALRTTWNADTPALTGTAPELVYEALEKDLKPHPDASGNPWARVTVRHATGGAAALGRKRFRREGTVFVQCFVPDKDGSAWTLAQSLASVAGKAYESARGGAVSFKDVAVKEYGRDGTFYRADCTAKFWWEEFR